MHFAERVPEQQQPHQHQQPEHDGEYEVGLVLLVHHLFTIQIILSFDYNNISII